MSSTAMRVGVASVATPPIRGGAEILADGLCEALARAGHRVHRIEAPFRFDAPSVRRSMDLWRGLDFARWGGGAIDRMICLKFPSYLLAHPSKVAWLLHQHRPVYELFGTRYGVADDGEGRALREAVREADRESLPRLEAIYTIARRVSERLSATVGVASRPLYHPPADAKRFRFEEHLPFVFAPSRLEALKRQDLLLRALARTTRPIGAVFAGSGGLREAYMRLAEELGVADRVRFLGDVPRETLIELYARCGCVFFGPFDEDYGYVSLEAMLSRKAIVTCADSGGPLEFVRDGETGRVVAPEPEAVAEAVEALVAGRSLARALGEAGRARYEAMGITWDRVAEILVGAAPAASETGGGER